MKDIGSMTRKEILAVPMYQGGMTHVSCKQFVIIPTRRKHSSGYRMIEIVVATDHGIPICKCTTTCDVISLLNYNIYITDRSTKLELNAVNKDWRIDCLPNSGLFRFFTTGIRAIDVEVGGSSIDIKGFVSQENTQ